MMFKADANGISQPTMVHPKKKFIKKIIPNDPRMGLPVRRRYNAINQGAL